MRHIIPILLILLTAPLSAQTSGQSSIPKKNSGNGSTLESFTLGNSQIIGRTSAGTLSGFTLGSGITLTGTTLSAASSIATSAGGNGAADTGKVALFGAVDGYDGSLSATSLFHSVSATGSSHGDWLVNDVGSSFTMLDNGTKSWTINAAFGTLTTDRNVYAQDKDGSLALLTNHLGEFAATTSAQLRSVLSDESGTGSFLTTNGSGASLTGLTASQVNLGNVNNTSDANKPISTATQTALDAKEPTQTAATLLEAQAGTETAVRKWSPLRVAQAADARTIPSSTIPTPAVLPEFWFRADAITAGTTEQPQPGAAVASWRDIASNLNTVPAQATGANQPTFQINEQTKLPCVRFDGGDYLSRTNLSVAAASGHTVIAVQRCTGVSNMSQQCIFAGGDTSWLAWSTNHSLSRIDVAGQSGSGFNVASPAYDRIAVVAYRVKASPVGGMTSRREYWLGQTRVAQQDTTLALPTTLQFSHLGAYINGTLGFTGDLFEVIGFASPLSDAQLAALVAQLEEKWQCQHNILVLDGNSLFSGSSGSNGLHVLLTAALGPRWYIKNVAVSGNTTAQRRSAFATSAAPLLGPRLDGRKNLLLFTEFRNHLGASGVSYADAWTEFQTYLSDATTAGAQAVATTMLPATAGIPTNNWTETNRLQGNTDIRATYSASTLFDWEALFQTAWRQSDGVHLNAGIGEPAVVAAFIAWMKTNGFYR